MDISEIATSVANMSDEELKKRLLEIRQSYRTPKATSPKAIKKEKKTFKKIDDMSRDDMQALLAVLKNQVGAS